MKLRERGFTIAEFIICLMIMFIIMGTVVTIPFKKSKITKKIQFQNGEVICDCNSPASDLKSGNVSGMKYSYCEFEIDNPTGKTEFYTVRLVGGGAAASNEIGGNAGEGKEMIYPALTGKYRIYLGMGGEYNASDINTPRNGGSTILYKVLDDGTLELMDFALGGSASMETIQEEELSGGATLETLALGKAPSFNIRNDMTGMKACGAGGNAPSYSASGHDGNIGGAMISW